LIFASGESKFLHKSFQISLMKKAKKLKLKFQKLILVFGAQKSATDATAQLNNVLMFLIFVYDFDAIC